MTFRLDLNLEGMKKEISLDDKNFEDFSSFGFIDDIRLPCRVTHKYIRISKNSDVGNNASSLRDYYSNFSRDIYHSNIRIPAALFSESLANILVHGGDAAKEADTLVESYHSSKRAKGFILRITNPEADEWDYDKGIRKFQEIPDYYQGRYGGFRTFSYPEFWVSYENGGRDFLALIRFP